MAGDFHLPLADTSKRTNRYRPLHIAVSEMQAHLVLKVREQFPDAELMVITETNSLRDMEREVVRPATPQGDGPKRRTPWSPHTTGDELPHLLLHRRF